MIMIRFKVLLIVRLQTAMVKNVKLIVLERTQ